MATEIKRKLSKLRVKIPNTFAHDMERLLTQYEIRKEHPLVLNSTEIGVHKIAFTSNDRAELFETCGIYEHEVSDIIKDISTIDKAFRVVSDPFNLLCVYLPWRSDSSSMSVSAKQLAKRAILLYWQYKMFSSIINHYFPYGVNGDIMRQVTEGLSMKFDVKVQGSWKKVMEEKVDVLLSKGSLHYDSLHTLEDDMKLLYVITDVQTRLRSQLKNITALYYDMKEANNYMRSTSATVVVDGKKIIRESSTGFETISMHIATKMLHKSSFVNTKYITMLDGIQKSLNKGIIARVISQLVDTATSQTDAGTDNRLIVRRDGTEIYAGLKLLVSNITRCTYANALSSKTLDINNKLDIFGATKNLFSAHQTNNKLLDNTKLSIAYFIERNNISHRVNTVSALTTTVALYICLMGFEFIH